MPFDQLHDIIQISMGWEEGFPYEFIVHKTRVRDSEEMDFGADANDRDVKDTFLDDLVTMVKTRFSYVYYLDRPRVHDIILEEISSTAEEDIFSVCIDGGGDVPEGDGFDVREVNEILGNYTDGWNEIYEGAQKTLDRLENDEKDEISRNRRYRFVAHFKAPSDVLKDESERESIQDYINAMIDTKAGLEYETFTRLVSSSYSEKESKTIMEEALAVESFYRLKYGGELLKSRYHHNLSRLPEKPVEVSSLDCALDVLWTSTQGVPFAAIEYLHDDTSREALSSILEALNAYANYDSIGRDTQLAVVWFAIAAEGHLCEELIDPVVNLFNEPFHENESDLLHEQGEYLIGKLAQEFPDSTADKVLLAMEKAAAENRDSRMIFLFDAFHFCDKEKYKSRLIALLQHVDVSFYDFLVVTVAHLQIKEALPVLKEQRDKLKSGQLKKGAYYGLNTPEIEEAIEQLETGVELYPEADMPFCLSRNMSWKEKYSEDERYFYYEPEYDGYDDSENDFELSHGSGSDPFSWTPQMPIIKENKTGRNDPCPCGSGKKYKKCCLDKDQKAEAHLH